MTFLRTILADLREKRLWPVALLLVVALIAVPVVLSMGGAAAEEPAQVAGVPAGAASAAAIAAEVTLDTSKPEPQQRPGPLRDPFLPPKAARTAKAASPAAPSAATPSAGGGPAASPSSPTPSSSGSSGATSSGSSSPGASTPSAGAGAGAGAASPSPAPARTTTTTTTRPAPPIVPAARKTLQVDLRFNEVGGAGKRLPSARPDVLRLAPLPSAAEPTVVYLGMLKDKAAAVFLLSGAASATGEGTCVPRPGDCQALELPVGGTEYLDMGEAGAPRQFELGVERAKIRTWATARAAAQVRDRRSRAGLQVIRDAIATNEPGLAFYRHDPATGLLTRLRPGATK